MVALSSSSWPAVVAREREKGVLLLDVVAVTSGGGVLFLGECFVLAVMATGVEASCWDLSKGVAA